MRNTVGYTLKNIDNQTTDGKEKSRAEVIKLGLDLHARQVTECPQLDGSTPKPAPQWDLWKLLDSGRVDKGWDPLLLKNNAFGTFLGDVDALEEAVDRLEAYERFRLGRFDRRKLNRRLRQLDC